jgi:Mn-dependent DtxR family transcriptional regulator
MAELSGGSLIQTGMVGRDGVIGAAQAIDIKKSMNKIVVQVPGAASVIDRAPLQQLIERGSALSNVFASHEQFFIADIQRTAACNAIHSADARMARCLLRLRDLVGEELPLTQESLAAMIGVVRATVSTNAHALQVAGVISYSRGRIHITDAALLQKHSCECHQAVHENYEALLEAPWPSAEMKTRSPTQHGLDRSARGSFQPQFGSPSGRCAVQQRAEVDRNGICNPLRTSRVERDSLRSEYAALFSSTFCPVVSAIFTPLGL